MIPQATINSSSNNGSTISISFSADYTEIYSGWFAFYDSYGSYIGYSDYFWDYETGSLSNILNNGLYFYINGNDNSVIINSSNIYFADGYNFIDISSFIIVLTGDDQYAGMGKSDSFDCSSFSAREYFK